MDSYRLQSDLPKSKVNSWIIHERTSLITHPSKVQPSEETMPPYTYNWNKDLAKIQRCAKRKVNHQNRSLFGRFFIMVETNRTQGRVASKPKRTDVGQAHDWAHLRGLKIHGSAWAHPYILVCILRSLVSISWFIRSFYVVESLKLESWESNPIFSQRWAQFRRQWSPINMKLVLFDGFQTPIQWAQNCTILTWLISYDHF